MRILTLILAMVGLLGLTSCSKFKSYDGPEVTRIIVKKAERRMYLLNNDNVLRSYNVDLGFAPAGPKQFESDGRTPEGRYRIDRKNPNSSFHLSLGISYPNVNDWTQAVSQGRDPGGDIFIHGARRPEDNNGPDWTAGCISVTDREVEEIYAMVREGTIIDIYP